MSSNFLQAQALENFRNQLKTIMGTEPADGAALLTAMDTYLTGTVFRKAIYQQALRDYDINVQEQGGQLTGSVTITNGGTGYEVGDIIPVTGSTSGEGGTLVVTSVTGGVIDGIEIRTVGNNYVGTLTVDASGVGNGDAVLAMASAATYEGQAVVAAAIATVDAL